MEVFDKGEFALAIGAMLEMFGQEATKPLLHAYWLGLCDMELSDVQNAVAKAIRTRDRRPTPAEMRTLAGEQTKATAAIAAWSDVQKAWPLGSYKHVDFSDPIINATIRSLGGWVAMFEHVAEAESEKWYRHNFLRTYENLASSGVDGELCRPLAGLSVKQVINGQISDPIPKRIECDPTRHKLIANRQQHAIESSLQFNAGART